MIRANRYYMLLLVFLMACTPSSESANEAADPSGTLKFIHLNDTYRIDAVEDGNAGGFSRVVTLIRGLQKQGNLSLIHI